MRFVIPVAVVAMSLSAAALSANVSMKPGLWEVTMKSDAMRDMPEMTPAQREQMKKMGIEMPMKRDGAMVQKVCVTKEMAQKDHLPMANEQSECKLKNQNRSGDNYRVDLECNGPNLKGTGVVKGTFSDGNQYRSTYDFDGTSRGRPVKQHHESSGKWLSADCGNVKPMGQMMRGHPGQR